MSGSFTDPNGIVIQLVQWVDVAEEATTG